MSSTGKVTRFANFGAFVEIEDGIEGLATSRNFRISTSISPRMPSRQGQKLQFKILKMDREAKKIGLSARAVGKDEPIIDVRSYTSSDSGWPVSARSLTSIPRVTSESIARHRPGPQIRVRAVRPASRRLFLRVPRLAHPDVHRRGLLDPDICSMKRSGLIWIGDLCGILSPSSVPSDSIGALIAMRMSSGFSGLGGSRIAVIPVEGVINDEMAKSVNRHLKQYASDNRVRAILMRVDSPGGGVAASQEIYREVKRAQEEQKKTLVVSMGTVAASGGYYIACPADYIFANPGIDHGQHRRDRRMAQRQRFGWLGQAPA